MWLRFETDSLLLFSTEQTIQMPFWQIIYFYDFDVLADHTKFLKWNEEKEKERTSIMTSMIGIWISGSIHMTLRSQRIGNEIDFIFVAVDVLCLELIVYDGFIFWLLEIQGWKYDENFLLYDKNVGFGKYAQVCAGVRIP